MIGLMVITYVPIISMALPNILKITGGNSPAAVAVQRWRE
jgi:hypothetical protein